MKLKHVFTTLGLASVMVLGVGVALAHGQKQASKVQADADTWMINVTFKSNAYLDGLTDPGSLIFRCGKEGEGGWKELAMTGTGVDYLYNANVTFGDSFEFNRIQFKFQEGGVDKYSQTYSLSGTKASHNDSYNMYASTKDGEGWEGDNWKISGSSYVLPYIKYDDVTHTLEPDVANARYIARDVEITTVGSGHYYNLQYGNSWDYAHGTLTDSTISDYFSPNGWDFADSWCVMAETGTYDIILKNNCNDNGIIEFKKHEVVDTYIYYLSEANFGLGETPNYIYTFGGAEQFGPWPGTEIATIAEEVTNHGVLRFDGVYGEFHDQSQYIYKIPVKIGYPSGDEQFVISYQGGEPDQTGDKDLEAGNAYAWGWSNKNKGLALDFLLGFEAIRNAVVADGEKGIKDYSVCGISPADATALVEEFNGLIQAVRNPIRDSFIYTYAPVGSGNEMVSMNDVLDQLAEISGVALAGQSISLFSNRENNTFIIVVIACTIAAASVGAFFIIRRRKHQ